MESLDFQTALGFTESFADQNVVVQGVPDLYPGGLFEDCCLEFSSSGFGSYYTSAAEEDLSDNSGSSTGSHVDEDDIIDIETVEDGINIVQKMKEDANELVHVKNALSGSSARTTPINRSTMPKTVTTTQPEPSTATNTATSTIPLEIALLHELTSESVEQAIITAQNETEGTVTKSDEEAFSLLGIDGIEAEDLESLFVQFEDMAEFNPNKQNPLSAPVSPDHHSSFSTSQTEQFDDRLYKSAPCSPTRAGPLTGNNPKSLTLSFPVAAPVMTPVEPPVVCPSLSDHDYCSSPAQNIGISQHADPVEIQNAQERSAALASASSSTASTSLSDTMCKKYPGFRRVQKKHSDRSYRQHSSPTLSPNASLLDKLPNYMTSLSATPKVDPVMSLPLEAARQERVVDRDPSPKKDDPHLLSKLPAYYNCFTKSNRYDKSSENSLPSTSNHSKFNRDKHKRMSRRDSRSKSRRQLPRQYRTSSASSSGSSESSNESTSDSSDSSRSRSRNSRSMSKSTKPSRASARKRCPSSDSSRSPSSDRERRKEAEHEKAMAERRVVYVGGISEKFSSSDLRKRFGGFGEIEDATVHIRQKGDNYGFVTFYSTNDAYAAIEKGNDVHGPKYELCFGGRRMFCKTDYADLDGCTAVKEEWAPNTKRKASPTDDFDALLKQSIKKLKKR